ncbi:IS30 family transposase [Microbulbifer sp. THAF38]|uniref:IS30 family transposase n=1 Tax=Microbulbifer sp. THAF38 TaxID=2587856 RepID=UPI001267B790|nr:IS30 family transposase [Microbulbifer sp. THAF38]QFT53915.1 Integrase core domain protein [Microbulbifer sp. THAF38]
MGTRTSQLTLKERYQIEVLNGQNYSARAIGLRLNRSNKTISRELGRYSPYCAESAHRQALQRRHGAIKHTKLDFAMQVQIDHQLKNASPEQIAGRMRLERCTKTVSCSTIYRWVSRLNWRSRLPRKAKPYQKRAGSEAGVKLIPERIDIDQRPAIVDENTEIGHWEGDTVYGQDGYLVTLVERVSKLLLTRRVPNKSKKTVSRAIKQMLKPYQAICKTITFDNGGEFAGHQSIAQKLGCRIYFAKPYHSWERGLNENTNGLLRRFFPKGVEIGKIPKSRIDDAVFRINTRPRKVLNYLSPLEFLVGKRVSLMLAI